MQNLNKLGFLHLISNSNYIQFKQAMNNNFHQQIQCIIQLANKSTLVNITKCEFTIGKNISPTFYVYSTNGHSNMYVRKL